MLSIHLYAFSLDVFIICSEIKSKSVLVKHKKAIEMSQKGYLTVCYVTPEG